MTLTSRMWILGGSSLLAAFLTACTMLTGADDFVASEQECTGVCPTGSPQRKIEQSNSPATPAPNTSPPSAKIEPAKDPGGTPTDAEAGPTPDPNPVDPPPNKQPDDNFVECGNTTCTGANAACCVGDQGSTKECFEKGGTCNGAAVVTCGGRANCGAGEVCCLTLQGRGSAECKAESSCTGESQYVFCRTATDCPRGQQCVNSTGSFEDHKLCI